VYVFDGIHPIDYCTLTMCYLGEHGESVPWRLVYKVNRLPACSVHTVQAAWHAGMWVERDGPDGEIWFGSKSVRTLQSVWCDLCTNVEKRCLKSGCSCK